MGNKTTKIVSLHLLKCAQSVKRSSCVVSHKWIEPTLFSVIINTDKTFKRFRQFFGNVLPVLISLKKRVSVQFIYYVKQHSLLSLHLELKKNKKPSLTVTQKWFLLWLNFFLPWSFCLSLLSFSFSLMQCCCFQVP